MPGNEWEKFANLRAYYAYMWAHPGKKLLFMGCEFAQEIEWNHDGELAWGSLMDQKHQGVQTLVRDLNTLYRETPALHQWDARPEGLEWIEGDNRDESVYAWLRWGDKGCGPRALCVFNFTPIERRDKRIGVPAPGMWREIMNTDADSYAGGGRGTWVANKRADLIAWARRLYRDHIAAVVRLDVRTECANARELSGRRGYHTVAKCDWAT